MYSLVNLLSGDVVCNCTFYKYSCYSVTSTDKWLHHYEHATLNTTTFPLKQTIIKTLYSTHELRLKTCIFQSCILQPCYLVCQIPILHFPRPPCFSMVHHFPVLHFQSPHWIHTTSTNKSFHHFVHATLYTTTFPVYPLLTTSTLCWIINTVLYGCETWTYNKKIRDKLLAFEMYCYWRILHISWTEQKTNVKYVINSELKRHIQRKLRLFGHIYRMKDNRKFKTLMSGIVDGMNKRGRPCRERMDDKVFNKCLNVCELRRKMVKQK